MFVRCTLLGTLALIASPAIATQTPLNGLNHHEIGSYKLKWPVRTVAIIGAGPGYREFIKAGFDVHLFERDSIPTGNWHYTEETPVDAPIPNADISIADFTPSLPPPDAKLPVEQVFYGKDSREIRRSHRGPKPIWSSLHSNAPAFAEIPWPKGTDWELPHSQLGRYVRAFASFHGVNSNDDNPRLSFNTRVELIEKRYDEFGAESGWTLTLKEIITIDKDSTKAIWYKRDFDAVVIAPGRYNAPNIPNIPGLDVWNQRFPGRLRHSRQYRRPEPYTGQKVLIIGAANSGGEIARDLSPHVNTVYVSVRPDNGDVTQFLFYGNMLIVPR
ncbi:hypothetical protein H0H93_006773 [Arthromyces matolae]|nr:hypothetical protein H0H93_006773 [Arthromyces matolae]